MCMVKRLVRWRELTAAGVTPGLGCRARQTRRGSIASHSAESSSHAIVREPGLSEVEADRTQCSSRCQEPLPLPV